MNLHWLFRVSEQRCSVVTTLSKLDYSLVYKVTIDFINFFDKINYTISINAKLAKIIEVISVMDHLALGATSDRWLLK